jgi:DNA-binding NtrC family response regulator
MAGRVLIIDDDPTQRRILEEMVKRSGLDVTSLDGASKALDLLSGAQAHGVKLIILDLIMPGMDGLDFLNHFQSVRNGIPVIVQTAQGSIETVVRAMRAGADDFVVKPISQERLRVSIQNLLKVTALTDEVKRLSARNGGAMTFDELIASSPAMANSVRLGRRAAQSAIPVLIEGESGVGKEVIARAIQGESDRRGKPFISVNCGALPANLVESILFGHEKGSFTGATGRHPGKFQEADGGTLFLDEVAELPLDIQVKLLRALQEGEIDPIGSKRPVRVNFRLISATNRNMIEMVKQGQFREDLYYRLNVFPILVPPLRNRPEDLPRLVEHFITRFAAEEGRKVGRISPSALELLKRYAWPGNVRQLENTIFRAMVLCEGDELQVEDFPQIASLVEGFEVKMPPAPQLQAPPPLPSGQAAMIGSELPLVPTTMASGMALGIPAVTEAGHIRRLEEVEADMIRLALTRYHGQMSEVARKLGIGRSTLYRKMRDMGLDEAKM